MDELNNYKQLYEQLLNENNELKNKINSLTEHLKKYTAPKRNKDYYHNNKEKIIKNIKKNQEHNKPDPEKIKEYNKRAYEKRKQKLKEISEN